MKLRMRARRRETGATAVEFALILPMLLYVVFAIIQYGLYFWATNTASAAAREGLRLVVVGDCTASGELQTFVESQLGGAGDPATLAVTPDPVIPSGASAGDTVTVTVQFDSINLNFPLLPVPNDGTVTREVDGRLEDTEPSAGGCPT